MPGTECATVKRMQNNKRSNARTRPHSHRAAKIHVFMQHHDNSFPLDTPLVCATPNPLFINPRLLLLVPCTLLIVPCSLLLALCSTYDLAGERVAIVYLIPLAPLLPSCLPHQVIHIESSCN